MKAGAITEIEYQEYQGLMFSVSVLERQTDGCM